MHARRTGAEYDGNSVGIDIGKKRIEFMHLPKAKLKQEFGASSARFGSKFGKDAAVKRGGRIRGKPRVIAHSRDPVSEQRLPECCQADTCGGCGSEAVNVESGSRHGVRRKREVRQSEKIEYRRKKKRPKVENPDCRSLGFFEEELL